VFNLNFLLKWLFNLTELEQHADDLSANPQHWMPWNYRETLAAAPAH
jgi:hypothetical protein